MTIVWIEHIVHALVAVVSRLVVLNFGRKIVEGEPRSVMASDRGPRNLYGHRGVRRGREALRLGR